MDIAETTSELSLSLTGDLPDLNDIPLDIDSTDEDYSELEKMIMTITEAPIRFVKHFNTALLLGVSLPTLYYILPYFVGALQAFAERSTTKRGAFIRMLRIFRSKICSCRKLKLRFLSLMNHDRFKSFWAVQVVYDNRCYGKENTGFDAFSVDTEDFESQDSADDNHHAEDDLEGFHCPLMMIRSDWRQWDLKTMKENFLTDTKFLIFTVISEIFHPERGVQLKKRKHNLRTYEDTFHAYEAVDFVISKLGLLNNDREFAVEVFEKVRKLGLIKRLGVRRHVHFKDNKEIWVTNVKGDKEVKDKATCVATATGEKIACFKAAQILPQEDMIKKIELTIPADDIDLQSLQFWSQDIYEVSPPKKTHQMGFRQLVNPLVSCSFFTGKSMCEEVDRLSHSRSRSETQSLQEQKSDVSEGPAISPFPSVSSPKAESESSVPVGETSTSNTFFVARIEKVFTSIAMPFVVSLRTPQRGSAFPDASSWPEGTSRILAKSGDDLMQDFVCESMFRLFNCMWRKNSDAFLPDMIPLIITYEIFPVSRKAGFMEVLKNVKSLKEYNWDEWKEKHAAKDKEVVKSMLRTAAGSYVGAYVLGVRDRHWDNILIKDDSSLIHIDFGFIMGQVPPIDASPFSVSPLMQEAFEEIGVWEEFLDLCGRAFKVLHRDAGRVLRAAEFLFGFAGVPLVNQRKHLSSEQALNIHSDEERAVRNVIKQVSGSSQAWKTKLKSVFHDNVDPVFYSLLRNHFPPAVLAFKIVDAKRSAAEARAASARKLSASTTSSSNTLSID